MGLLSSIFGGGGSSSSTTTSNVTDTYAPTTNINAAGSNAPVVTGSGDTILTTDLGSVDAATKIALGGLDVAGQTAVAAIGANTIIAGNYITAQNDLATKSEAAITAAATSAQNTVSDLAKTELGYQQSTVTSALSSVDSAFSKLGDSFTSALGFIGGQETQLQTATTSAITSVAAANQSETALQTTQIQHTLITIIGIVAVAGVLAVIAFKKG